MPLTLEPTISAREVSDHHFMIEAELGQCCSKSLNVAIRKAYRFALVFVKISKKYPENSLVSKYIVSD